MRSELALVCVVAVMPLAVPRAVADDAKKIQKLARECDSGKKESCRKLGDIARGDDRAVAVLSDQEELANVVENGVGDRIRLAAFERLLDPPLLARIARSQAQGVGRIRYKAIRKVRDRSVLADIVGDTSVSSTERREAIWQFVKVVSIGGVREEDTALLARIAENKDEYDWLRESAVWGHDALVRLRAGGGLSAALAHEDPSVRKDAVERLFDPAVLARIARDDADDEVRKAALSNKNFADRLLAAELAKTGPHPEVGEAAIGALIEVDGVTGVYRIPDQGLLLDIAKHARLASVRFKAANSLEDPSEAENMYTDLAKSASDWSLRRDAANRIANQSTLREIVWTDEDLSVRETATRKLSDRTVLEEVAQMHRDLATRRIAFAILAMPLCDKVLYASPTIQMEGSVGRTFAIDVPDSRHVYLPELPTACAPEADPSDGIDAVLCIRTSSMRARVRQVVGVGSLSSMEASIESMVAVVLKWPEGEVLAKHSFSAPMAGDRPFSVPMNTVGEWCSSLRSR